MISKIAAQKAELNVTAIYLLFKQKVKLGDTQTISFFDNQRNDVFRFAEVDFYNRFIKTFRAVSGSDNGV